MSLITTQQQLLKDIIYKSAHLEIYKDETYAAEQLLQVYQNNYISTLTATLKATYSAVSRLVGADFFNQLAYHYINNAAPKSGNIQDYGKDFPAFIKTMKACEPLPYLSDIATLEYYYEKCYYGKNSDYDFGRDYPNFQEKYINYGLKFSYLLQSDYPIIAIWQLNEQSAPLDLRQDGDNVLLYKYKNAIQVLRIETQIFNFLSAIQKEDCSCQ